MVDHMEYETSQKIPPSKQNQQRHMTNSTQLQIWYFIKKLQSTGRFVFRVVNYKKTSTER